MSRSVDAIDPGLLFGVVFSRAADSAAASFGYAQPDSQVVAGWLSRIPRSVSDLIGRGLAEGTVISGPTESTFTLLALAAGKGPYAWFSRNRGPGTPSPNWEYFFQVAEFVRTRLLLPSRFEVGFEDDLMDISVRHQGRLIWYIEVKPRAIQATALLRALKRLGDGVDLATPDRGDDPLRKAKYLIKHRPTYLSFVGGEERWHYAITYAEANRFTLLESAAGPEWALSSRPDRDDTR